MVEIIMTVGGLSILFGAFELLESDGKSKTLRKVAVEIIGGLLVVGVALLLKHFNVNINF